MNSDLESFNLYVWMLRRKEKGVYDQVIVLWLAGHGGAEDREERFFSGIWGLEKMQYFSSCVRLGAAVFGPTDGHGSVVTKRHKHQR